MRWLASPPLATPPTVVPNFKKIAIMNKLEVIYNILPETGPVAFEKPEIPLKEKNELEKELKSISDSVEFKTDNIGAGADWIIVLATLSGFFFLGDKINKNLEAWISLSKKFSSLFRRTKMKFIDSNGIRLLAIEKIIKNEETVESIEEISFNEINLHDLTNTFTDGRNSVELRSKPFCYYTITYRVNNYSYYMFGIKSDGEIRIIDKIGDTQYGFNQKFALK